MLGFGRVLCGTAIVVATLMNKSQQLKQWHSENCRGVPDDQEDSEVAIVECFCKWPDFWGGDVPRLFACNKYT